MSSLTFDSRFAPGPGRPRVSGPERLAWPAVRTPELRRLLQHWHDLKGEQRLPRRADLEPADIAYCLGDIALVEVEAPFRPRYRLVGTHLAELLGEDPTGHYVDEAKGLGARHERLAAYRRTIETGEPDYAERVLDLLLVKFGYYRLLLPFAWRSEGQADLIVAAYVPASGRLRGPLSWLGRNPS